MVRSRVRSAVLAGALAAGVLLGGAGPAAASHPGDVDCSDFAVYEDALAHLRAHPGDPDRLDADGDGQPCETLPRRGTTPDPRPAQPAQPAPPAPPACVGGAIGQRYASLGGERGFLGRAVTCELATPARPGRYNHFHGGSIYWSPSTGAWEVHGAIRSTWAALGWENSPVGFPTSNESRTPARPGAYNHFERGSVYWSPATGAHEVRGAIRDAWAAAGWENSPVGFPTSNESRTPTRPGAYNHFERGSAYWSPGTGAHLVHGAIRDAWAANGWEAGRLGFPTSGETPAAGGRRVQTFERGTITWTPAGGARIGLPGPDNPPAPRTAAGLLAQLPVTAENTSRYDRDLFPHWSDPDRDGCSTRDEVLISESLTPVTIGTGCAVSEGRWYSPYDDRTHTRAADLQIDHVVALSEAWDSGAHTWTTARREAFANDLNYPGALVAVTGAVNQAKADLDPAQWLPPHPADHCRYATTWVATKWRWGLLVDPAERDRLTALLAGGCGQTPVTVSRA
jgi:hypothetical protein